MTRTYTIELKRDSHHWKTFIVIMRRDRSGGVLTLQIHATSVDTRETMRIQEFSGYLPSTLTVVLGRNLFKGGGAN